FVSSRRRHTRSKRDWSSDVCSSDLELVEFQVDGTHGSGFHTGFGVCARCWATQLRKPATADPCVPSTWNSTSSSRYTRTAQEERIGRAPCRERAQSRRWREATESER